MVGKTALNLLGELDGHYFARAARVPRRYQGNMFHVVACT